MLFYKWDTDINGSFLAGIISLKECYFLVGGVSILDGWHPMGSSTLMEEGFSIYTQHSALCKLHKAKIKNNIWSVFSSFLSNRYLRNLVTNHIRDWFQITTGVLQVLILSPLFLWCTLLIWQWRKFPMIILILMLAL